MIFHLNESLALKKVKNSGGCWGCGFFGGFRAIKGEIHWGLLGVVGFLESLGTLKVKISGGCWGL